MAEEKKEVAAEKCNYTECAINWLKVVDEWQIGGYKNRFPRLYYVVAGLVVLYLIL